MCLVVEPLTCVFRPVEKGIGVLRIVSAEHGDRAAQDAKTGAIAGFVEGSFVNAAVFVFLLCMLYAGREFFEVVVVAEWVAVVFDAQD